MPNIRFEVSRKLKINNIQWAFILEAFVDGEKVLHPLRR